MTPDQRPPFQPVACTPERPCFMDALSPDALCATHHAEMKEQVGRALADAYREVQEQPVLMSEANERLIQSLLPPAENGASRQEDQS